MKLTNSISGALGPILAALLLFAPSALADDVILHTNATPGDVNLHPNATVDGATNLNADVGSIRKDRALAYKLARYRWLARAAEANPDLIIGITAWKGPSKTLAKHSHLGEIAQSDHYLCRRLAKWKGAGRAMARNGQADQVVALDPAGIYEAIKHDRRIARYLVKNPNFADMVIENPDLGEFISSSL
jgi:hypothetical protein